LNLATAGRYNAAHRLAEAYMSDPFLSSEEYDERAHSLYNEGKYDEALDVLRAGLALYPTSVELLVGMGYARLARDEYAWARRSFADALAVDEEHEDALAGLGEVLLKFGRRDQALATFRRTLELGYEDDVELMLQVGRALFREGLIEEAREFFDVATREAPENAEAVACTGYALHRLGDDDGAAAALRRALQLDADHVEARIYLGNLLYDRGDFEAALYHLDRSTPEDHWDELGMYRLIELKKQIFRLTDGDPELRPWQQRIDELEAEPDAIDDLLAEVEEAMQEEELNRGQLDLFPDDEERAADAGLSLTIGPAVSPIDAGAGAGYQAGEGAAAASHRVVTSEGREIDGTWEDIVRRLRDASGEFAGRSVSDFMTAVATRQYRTTGIRISARDAESFIRGSEHAGLLRIVR
jgi:Flp pilus assembly protein TadD